MSARTVDRKFSKEPLSMSQVTAGREVESEAGAYKNGEIV